MKLLKGMHAPYMSSNFFSHKFVTYDIMLQVRGRIKSHTWWRPTLVVSIGHEIKRKIDETT